MSSCASLFVLISHLPLPQWMGTCGLRWSRCTRRWWSASHARLLKWAPPSETLSGPSKTSCNRPSQKCRTANRDWAFLFHREHECDCFIHHVRGLHRHGKLLIDSSKSHQSKLLLIRADGRLWLADFNDVLTAMVNLQCLLFLWVFWFFSPP